MGPLSVKAQVQQQQGQVKAQMTVIKTLADEARKKDLHKLKMAKEIAKAKAEGFPIDDIDESPAIPKPNTNKSTVVGAGNQEQPTNPEAGPSDTIPAMLTPGEAVIPASVAQDPNIKPIIASLVNEGRVRNRQPGGVKGYADGTDSLPPMGKIEKRSLWDALTRKKEEPKKEEPKKPSGGMIDQAKGALGGRAGQLEQQERKAMGFADGDPNVGGFDLEGVLAGMKALDPDLNVDYMRDAYMRASPQERDAMIEKATSGLDKLAASDKQVVSPIDKSKLNPAEKKMADDVASIPPPSNKLSDSDKSEIAREIERLKKRGDTKAIATLQEISDKAATATAGQGEPIPRIHRRGGTSGFLRDMSQGMPNQEYDNELAKLERQGTPEQKPAAVEEQARLANARNNPAQQAEPGQPWQPVDYTVPPVPQVTAPTEPGVPPKPTGPVPQPSPKDMDPRDIRATKEYDNQIQTVLAMPAIQEELAAAQKEPPPPGVEPKSWLAEKLGMIFGKTGLFNEEDLIRFSVLAAGGLLTGGSVGGSIRFAGLATLKSSDERRAAKAAAVAKQNEQMRQAQIEASRHWRNRVETLETDFYNKMKDAKPEAKVKAQELFDKSREAKTVQEREAALTAGLRVLSGNRDKELDDKGDKFNKYEEGYDPKTGKPVKFYTNKKNEFFLIDDDGNHVPLKGTGKKVMSESQYKTITKEQDEMATKMIKGRLVDSNRRKDGSIIDKNKNDAYFSAKADELAATMKGLRGYIGYDMNPDAYGKLLSSTIMNIQEEIDSGAIKNVSPEAMTKIVLGSAMMQSRPSSAQYFKAGTNSGRPGAEATLMYTDVIENAKKRGEDVTEFMGRLEEAFKAIPDKKKWEGAAKAPSNIGYSPYLLWVKEQMSK